MLSVIRSVKPRQAQARMPSRQDKWLQENAYKFGFCYGDDDEYRVVFAGNRPDDKITIETCGGPLICPLKIMKEHFKVLTLFEVMERLEKRIDEAIKNGV